MDKIKEIWTGLVEKITGGKKKKEPALLTSVATQYEINLVPEVKAQMIRAQKMRNLVLFICIVVSVASVGVVLVLFGIKSGQDIAMSNQDKKLNLMSEKLTGYEELGDLVTIQGQLAKLEELTDNKTVLSRVFGAVGAMLPTGGDVVQLSELRVDLEANTLRLDAQADARVAPLIDYRVLESFKKGVALTKYDYGNYVDSNGTTIPTWCVKEADNNGVAFRSGESYYAWWDLTLEGCAAFKDGTEVPEDSDVELRYSKDAEVVNVETEIAFEDLQAQEKVRVKDDGSIEVLDETIEARPQEDGNVIYVKLDTTQVKIWRTPQFTAWHNGGWMELDGRISGIEHFQSECIKYTGNVQSGTAGARWTSTNDCVLAPDGLNVISSSNGRDESDNLVLKFTASASIAPEFFNFKNKHMIAIGPLGQNVTDSFVQIGGIFTQEAKECEEGDTECLGNASNANGGNETGGN